MLRNHPSWFLLSAQRLQLSGDVIQVAFTGTDGQEPNGPEDTLYARSGTIKAGKNNFLDRRIRRGTWVSRRNRSSESVHHD